MAMDKETRKKLLEKGLVRYKQERDYFKFLSDTLALVPSEEMQLSKEVTDITVERYETIIHCAEDVLISFSGKCCSHFKIFKEKSLFDFFW